MTSISFRERLTSTIDYVKSWMAENDQKLQAEQQAHDWQRHAVDHCTLHNATMFYDLNKAKQGLPEAECWTCWDCENEKRKKELEQARQGTTQALFSTPGEYSARIRASLQASYVRYGISAISTAPSLDERELATIPTNKLYNPNPATPTPETRAELFQNVPIDLPDSLILWDEEDSDATEMRPKMKITAPRITTTTIEIPAMDAEVAIHALANGPVHERGTGSFSPVREKHWML